MGGQTYRRVVLEGAYGLGKRAQARVRLRPGPAVADHGGGRAAAARASCWGAEQRSSNHSFCDGLFAISTINQSFAKNDFSEATQGQKQAGHAGLRGCGVAGLRGGGITQRGCKLDGTGRRAANSPAKPQRKLLPLNAPHKAPDSPENAGAKMRGRNSGLGRAGARSPDSGLGRVVAGV